jgi:hypothetical protein
MCSPNSNLLIFNPELKLWAVIAPRYSLFSAVGSGTPTAQIMQDLTILQKNLNLYRNQPAVQSLLSVSFVKKPSNFTEFNSQSKPHPLHGPVLWASLPQLGPAFRWVWVSSMGQIRPDAVFYFHMNLLFI